MADVNSAIGHASSPERSGVDGYPGDSTGKEVCVRSWYQFATKILRPPKESWAAVSAYSMEQACANEAIGYSQYATYGAGRLTLWSEAQKVGYDLSKITTPCNCDCSSLVNACVVIGSILCEDVDSLSYVGFSTGSEVSALISYGYTDVTSQVGTTSPDYLQRGDVLWKSGHTAMVLLNGSKVVNQNYAMDGAMTSGSSVAYAMGSLYEEQVEKYDATLKEVGYLNSSFEPSISPSNIKLSVINYTNLLGNLFTQYIPENITNMFNSMSGNFDGVENEKAKTIFRLLAGYEGMTLAGAVGIVANMYHEAVPKFNAASKGDYVKGVPTSFGLCQWHYGRGDNMKAHCLAFNGVSWENNVSGQVDYLIKELKNSYKSTWNTIQNAPNTLDGAKEVAEFFCIHFEIPSDRYNKAKQRAETAEMFWNQVVLVQGSGGYA